jgi:hypothetical protein
LNRQRRQCKRCGSKRPISEFTKHARNKDGLRDWCKGCEREEKLFARYGITSIEFTVRLVAQDGGCGICGNFRQLVVDHEHVSGRIRGLLCQNCNKGIGLLGDSIEGVRKAVDYLHRSEARSTLTAEPGQRRCWQKELK